MREFPNMTEQRWKQLSARWDERLTVSELVEGWHFCPDLSGRLIHPRWHEYRHCKCGHSGKYGDCKDA
jgi:hypothetical protein